MPTKVVIVEDDIAIAAMYQFKLEHRGYDVRVAHDGSAGLALTKDFTPEIILLDIRMPVMTGDVMLEKLRATVWGSDIKVIILTNISKAEAPQKLRFLNVDRYVVKAHHTPSQVVNIVDEVLSS
ncbi:MAG: response regulator [Candidatus Saccharibacteria bacterium]